MTVIFDICPLSIQFFGWVGDEYGRFPATFFTNVILLAAGLSTPFCTNFVAFCFMRFFAGIAYDSSLQIFYLLCEKDCSISTRNPFLL